MAIDDGPVRVSQQEIVKLDLQINALIQDIRACEGPLDVLHSINASARQKIQQTKIKIEDLERLAREQDKETDQLALLKHVDSYRKQLSSTQTSLRQANLSCQMRIEKEEKHFLLTGGTEARQRVKSNKANLVKGQSNITENLMSISRTMNEQVNRSEQTMNVLVPSSQKVTSVHGEFENMNGHIQHSRKLITKYGRRECTDKLLILLALVFFFATVLYIIKKRIFTADSSSSTVGPT